MEAVTYPITDDRADIICSLLQLRPGFALIPPRVEVAQIDDEALFTASVKGRNSSIAINFLSDTINVAGEATRIPTDDLKEIKYALLQLAMKELCGDIDTNKFVKISGAVAHRIGLRMGIEAEHLPQLRVHYERTPSPEGICQRIHCRVDKESITLCRWENGRIEMIYDNYENIATRHIVVHPDSQVEVHSTRPGALVPVRSVYTSAHYVNRIRNLSQNTLFLAMKAPQLHLQHAL